MRRRPQTGACSCREVVRVLEEERFAFAQGSGAPTEIGEFKVVEQPKPGLAQTALWFGFPSIDVRGADRYAIEVLDSALSGASLPGGRLHARLRDNQLVYVVHAYNSRA
jgi:hypothetical protein